MLSSNSFPAKSQPKHKPRIIVIVGPTASGKSDLGIFLAKKLKGEIISADSRQVYKGMNIGSGKVTKREQQLIPHHLLDVVSPKKEFTAEEYRHLAKRALKKVFRKRRVPIIVGGTGFYIDALVYDIEFPNVPPNHSLRKELNRFSAADLFKKLKQKDPIRARTIDPDNKVRLIRALEIVEVLGRVPQIKKTSPYDVLWVGITHSKRILGKRIEKRLDARIKKLLPEVKKLLKSGVSFDRLYRFGLEYRWVSQFLYLKGRQTLDQMRMGLLRSISHYAKRQMTWFKRNKDIHWIKTKSQALNLARGFLNS